VLKFRYLPRYLPYVPVGTYRTYPVTVGTYLPVVGMVPYWQLPYRTYSRYVPTYRSYLCSGLLDIRRLPRSNFIFVSFSESPSPIPVGSPASPAVTMWWFNVVGSLGTVPYPGTWYLPVPYPVPVPTYLPKIPGTVGTRYGTGTYP